MKSLGIIPARGGSKGITLKNIKPLAGRPLMEYAMESALASGVLDKVLVSTDHPEIEKIAAVNEIDVVRRPPELSRDESPTEPALIHALEFLEQQAGYVPDITVVLEPTSPFRSPGTIRACVKVFEEGEADSVVGVVRNFKRLGTLKGGFFNFILPEHRNTPRRQDREPFLEESGTIWAVKSDILREKGSLFGHSVYPLLIPDNEVFDINTESDFKMAEKLMRERLK